MKDRSKIWAGNNKWFGVNKKLTYTNTVGFPEVADKKSYPIRWLIVLLSFFGSVLFTLIVLLFNHRIKQH